MNSIKEYQNTILEFDKKRNWDYFYPYELLLNLTEEIDEIWQKLAWVSDEKKYQIN